MHLAPDPAVAARYVRENFAPADRVAVVLINKRINAVIQRLASVEAVTGGDVLDWLARHNQEGYDLYVSMNVLRSDAIGRTKNDIASVRHIYLDFDEEGTRAVRSLLERDEMPKPNYLLNSSPDKWQVVWKVEGFGKTQAEGLQKSLAQEWGADRAATDCARVLRLPGFLNHKYAVPHRVGIEGISKTVYRPESFPVLTQERRPQDMPNRRPDRKVGPRSQSERDWAFAKRAIARGDSPASVANAIAQYRRFDKHNPQYYAELTIRKAEEAVRAESKSDSGLAR